MAGATMTVYTWMTMAVRSDTALSGSASPPLGESVGHVGVALAGNLIGGIGFVTLTRLFQVSGEPHDPGHLPVQGAGAAGHDDA